MICPENSGENELYTDVYKYKKSMGLQLSIKIFISAVQKENKTLTPETPETFPGTSPQCGVHIVLHSVSHRNIY